MILKFAQISILHLTQNGTSFVMFLFLGFAIVKQNQMLH